MLLITRSLSLTVSPFDYGGKTHFPKSDPIFRVGRLYVVENLKTSEWSVVPLALICVRRFSFIWFDLIRIGWIFSFAFSVQRHRSTSDVFTFTILNIMAIFSWLLLTISNTHIYIHWREEKKNKNSEEQQKLLNHKTLKFTNQQRKKFVFYGHYIFNE